MEKWRRVFDMAEYRFKTPLNETDVRQLRAGDSLCGLTGFWLIWVTRCANMGRHTMKTTIEIADDLFKRTQQAARRQRTTFRALVEEGLRLALGRKQRPLPQELPPLVTFGKGGTTAEFKDWNWDRISDEIYHGRGA
jgi:hypothetical protein